MHPSIRQLTHKFSKFSRVFGRFLFFGGIIAIGIIIMRAMAYEPLEGEFAPFPVYKPVHIYAADSSLIGTIKKLEEPIEVSYEDLQTTLVKVLMATQGEGAGESGVDYWEGMRSLVNPTAKLGISQRVVRDMIEQEEKEHQKLSELFFMSQDLEKKFTQEQILSYYANSTCIYDNVYGVARAAQLLFDKTLTELSWAEAATIGGLILAREQGVTVWSNKQAKRWRNRLLNRMIERDPDNQERLERAKMDPLNIDLAKHRNYKVGNSFMQMAEEWVTNENQGKWAFSQELHVYTTLDLKMQKHAEDAIQAQFKRLQEKIVQYLQANSYIIEYQFNMNEEAAKTNRAKEDPRIIYKQYAEPMEMVVYSPHGAIDTIMSFFDSLKYYAQFMNVGKVSMDPNTGDIKVWVGNSDARFFPNDNIKSRNGDGGTILKPFVYMNMSVEPCEWVEDQFNWMDFYYNRNNYKQDTVEVKRAKFRKLLHEYELLNMELKFLKSRSENWQSLVNGLMLKLKMTPRISEYGDWNGTTNLLELIGGYGAIANGGEYVEPHWINSILNEDKKEIFSHTVKPYRVIQSKDNKMLVQALTYGSELENPELNRLRKEYEINELVGIKHGEGHLKEDAWFVGFTPDLVTAIWTGMGASGVSVDTESLRGSINTAMPIWADFFQRLRADSSIVRSFETFTFYPNYRSPKCPPSIWDSDAFNIPGLNIEEEPEPEPDADSLTIAERERVNRLINSYQRQNLDTTMIRRILEQAIKKRRSNAE